MLKPHLEINEDGDLTIGDLSTVEISERFGTPAYVTDEGRLRDNYCRFREAFSSFWSGDLNVQYAYKANSNLALCKALYDEGCGAEVGSLCELKIALKTGYSGEKITFNANNKSEEEIELAVRNNVLIHADNIQELDIIEKIAKKLDEKAKVGFRVNPNIEAPTHPHISTGLREEKFGIDVPSGKALKAYEKAAKNPNIELKSIHSHIGSQILDPSPFLKQAKKVLEIRKEIKEKTGVELDIINLGGGLGIPYKPNEEELSPEVFAKNVLSTIEECLESQDISKPKIVLEPGRFLVADTTLLLGRVGYVKERKNSPDWVSIDAGMNALIRPALYGSYHHIEAANKMNEEKTETYNIAGPLCESGDYLGKGRELPSLDRGDLLSVYDVGAYGLSMSNNHTANTRPAMVMVRSGDAEVVRERENCEDLTRFDKLPEWL